MLASAGYAVPWSLRHPLGERAARAWRLAQREEPEPEMGEKILRTCAPRVQESMRFIPVSGGTVRASPAPLQLGGYTIPAGVEILFASHGGPFILRKLSVRLDSVRPAALAGGQRCLRVAV